MASILDGRLFNRCDVFGFGIIPCLKHSKHLGFKLWLNLGCNTLNNYYRSFLPDCPWKLARSSLGRLYYRPTYLQMLCSFVGVCHAYEYHLTHLTAAVSLQGDLHVSLLKRNFWFKHSQVNSYPDLWPGEWRKGFALSGQPREKWEKLRLMDDKTPRSFISQYVTLAFRLSLYPTHWNESQHITVMKVSRQNLLNNALINYETE